MIDLTLDAARIIVATALETARARGLKPLAAVVYDSRGSLKCVQVEDGASLRRPEIALGKANGALALGLGSRAIHARAEAQPYFVAAVSHVVGPAALVPVPGGVLVRSQEGRLLGAVGISGDTSDNDEICAVAGIEAAGLVLRPAPEPMRLPRRRWLTGAAALALAGPSAARAAGPAEYRRGNDADPETLDPHRSSTVAEAHILRDLYDGLLTYDNHGAIIPGAAQSWRVSGDALTYTFTLRQDGRWSNGEAVEAEAFVYSLRRILAPETAAKYAEVLFPLRNAAAINRGAMPAEALGVSAPDARTVTIALEAPTPYLLELLTHQTALPVHRPSVERHGDGFTRPGNLVSNGPYALAESVPNDRIVLAQNRYFHAAAEVAIPRVAFVPTPDLSSAVRRYGAGELDSLADLPGDQMASLKTRFGDQVVLGPSLGLYALAVNTRKAPFDDIRVRRALSLALDREYLAEALWGGTMSPAYSLCPPGLDNYRTPPETEGRENLPIDNEDLARQLLAEAGFGPGRPLRIEYRFNTTDNNRNTAVAVAEMWRGLGIETRFVYTDAKTHFAYLRDGGDFDVARMSWIADYSDPQNFLFLLTTGNDGMNPGHWSNPEYDGLLAQAAAERDLAARADLLHRAEAIVMRDLPWIPVMHTRSKALIAPRLHGYVPNLRNAAPTRFLRLVG